MESSSKYLDSLIREFSRLPGIGNKSATRLAFHILKMPADQVDRLSESIVELKRNIRSCTLCGGISDDALCSVCSSPDRDNEILCVVEEPEDMISIERTGAFRGLYHVLGGVIAPLDGIGPEDLRINELVQRCNDQSVKEVILATNPTVEGDATSLYVARILKPMNIRVMRIAHGLPVGSDLEFADGPTLAKSLSGRVEM
ncbi:MAG: recombination mediator RecR [Spirochaetota bacterium]